MTDFNDNSAASPPVTALAPKPVAHPAKLQPAAAPQLYKQALDWQRALKSNTLGNVLPGALAGLTVGTYGGALYLDATHNRRVPAKEEQARNRKVLGRSALGGTLLGGLAGAGLGYHLDVMDGLREMTWAAEDAGMAGRWRARAKREHDAWADQAKAWRQRWSQGTGTGTGDHWVPPPTQPDRNTNDFLYSAYDSTRHSEPLRRVWDTVVGSSELRDSQAARRAADFMGMVGKPGADQAKLRQIMESFPQGSATRQLFNVLLSRQVKTAAIQDTLRRYGL